MRFNKAKQLCGLEQDFEIRSDEDFSFAQRVWKERMVVARNTNDNEACVALSQARVAIRKRYFRLGSKCPLCGSVKSRGANHCQVCNVHVRNYANSLPQPLMKEHEIEAALTLVPPRSLRTGILSQVCRKLATEGQPGDSFVTNKPSTSVKTVCRAMGMEVIVRLANPDEKDKKKQLHRVWRSDGMNEYDLNAHIQQRREHPDKVQKAPPCKAPPPVERKKKAAK